MGLVEQIKSLNTNYYNKYELKAKILDLLAIERKKLQDLWNEKPNPYEKGSMIYLPLASEWEQYLTKLRQWIERIENVLGVGVKE